MTYQTPEIVEMGEANELIQVKPGFPNIENDPFVSRNYQQAVDSEDEE